MSEKPASPGSLFGDRRHDGVRVVVTGQVGVEKKPFLEHVAAIARERGKDVAICHVGDMMYAEAPDIVPGRILDLPRQRLDVLRRSVFKDILNTAERVQNLIVNTHATFRWKHGLFLAYDYDHLQQLDADLYVVLVDNIDRVHARLRRDGHADHTLKDLMVWREEEILATELLSQIVRPSMYGNGGEGAERGGGFYICARGDDGAAASTLARLILHPEHKKAYLSFPMSHVDPTVSGPVLAEIDAFRREIKRHFICFDPGDVEEKHLCAMGLQAAEHGHRTVRTGAGDEHAVLDTNQLVEIIPDIDGQIYARDFKLIDQSDMIVSLIPELEDGRAALSSGVERELQHAHEGTKDVFVVWKPAVAPSPFITETATRVFSATEEAVAFFLERYAPPPSGTLFA